jgi:putative RNA 2'-phosphotransferase
MSSKKVTYYLRHKDDYIDEHGWAYCAALCEVVGITEQELEDIVNEVDVPEKKKKRRLEFNEDKSKVRAVQGHSVPIDIQLTPQNPPFTLYHGTVDTFMKSITKEGLKKMNRNHVHLSPDLDHAINIASRRKSGKRVILVVAAKAMYADGFKFYKAKNGVWLTESVPAKYLTVM